MANRPMSLELEVKLKERIAERLQKNKSFGYKVINNAELQVINKYYSTIYGQSFNFNEQKLHLFGSFQTMYAYLVLGLTNVGDLVLLPELVNDNIYQCIKGLDRKTLKMKISELSNIIGNKSNKITLLVLANPDLTTGSALEKKKLKNVLQLCNKNEITVICDESMSTICPNQNFYSSMNEQYHKLILIKQIGMLFNKYIAFFGSTEIKQRIQNSAAKSLKILPSDLTLTLIHTSMSEDGRKYQQQLIKSIRINYEQLRKLMMHFKCQSTLPNHCQNQYFMVDSESVQPQISAYILQFLPSEIIAIKEKRLIRINLNCQIEEFKEGLKRIAQSIPQSKL